MLLTMVLPNVVVFHGIDGSVFQCRGFAGRGVAGRGVDGHGAAAGGVADHGDTHRGVADLLMLTWFC